jgi:hypothetical protein
MTNSTRLSLSLSVALVGLGCAVEPVPEPPPLFSAYDPTVQCPEGQVGWDLSTGGGLEPLQRNSVGDSIKLINANLTNCGLTGMDLRAACDGEAECTRQVTCDDSAVDVTYVCGTEPSTYTARVEGTGSDRILRVSCGLPIVILNAQYGNDSNRRADISAQLAARCSGKRRCTSGASGYSLNSFVDPAPNQAKTVKVRYRCGIEPAERLAELDDFKLDFYCPLAATKFPIRELIRVVSAEPRFQSSMPSFHAENVAYAAELKAQIAKACDGKSQCDVTFTGRRADGRGVSNWNVTADNRRAWVLRGTDVMGWPDTSSSTQYGDSAIGDNRLIVGYTCGADSFVNYRAINPLQPAPNNRTNIRCGDVITVTGVDTQPYRGQLRADPIFTNIVKARCDGKRVCTPPGFFGVNGSGALGGFRVPDGGVRTIPDRMVFRYTCGDLVNSVSSEVTINSYEGGANEAQVECPPSAGDLLATGVKLVTVAPAERTLEVARLCGGRDRCTAPAGVTATYRCQDDPQLKTSNPEMRCTTQIYLKSITSSGYACWEQPNTNSCVAAGQSGTCNYYPRYASDWGRFSCGDVTFNYTCGCDPTVRSITYPPKPPPTCRRDSDCGRGTSCSNGGNSRLEGRCAGGLPAQHDSPAVLTCPSVTTACTRKACIPKVCTGATRRNADLACVSDTAMKPTHFNAVPVVNDWVALPDGGTHPVGQPMTRPADNTFVYKSGFPYQVFSSVLYKPDDGRALNDRATALVWSYDQFDRRPGATRPDGGVLPANVFGLRCALGQASLRGAERPSTVPGYRFALLGGKGQTIPSNCYDQDGFNDPSTSFFDAAAASSLPESQFRERYTRSRTFIVSSFDPDGTSVVRRLTPSAPAVGVNPIGFFYDPRRDYVSVSGFYSQSADFTNAIQARFVPSTEIELGALFETVSYGDLTVDVEDPDKLPSFDIGFSWYLRGDSPANPYSPRTRVANNPANTSLKDRNLRMTIEMARSDTGLVNPWVASNAVRFPSIALSEGNNFLQTDQGRAQITANLRRRLLTVRTDPNALAVVTAPDGFMSDSLDEDTAFLVRTCIDLDGLNRDVADTNVDNVTLPALNGYSLRVARRCAPPRTIIFQRQLFVRPTLPAANEEVKNDKGGVQPSGDRDVGGSNANGAEVGCVRQCTTNADCGITGTCNPGTNGMLGTCAKTSDNRQCKDSSRAEGGLGGQFPISMFSSRKDSTSELSQKRAGEAQTTNCSSARGSLVGFSVLEPMPRCEDRLDMPSKWEVEMEISPNIDPIIAFFKGKKYGVFNTDAKKSLMKRKNASIQRSGKESRRTGVERFLQSSGVGLSAGREFYITIGPVPIVVEVGASAGFSFKAAFKFEGESAKASLNGTPQMSNFYPCVNASNTSCYTVQTEPKTFDEAIEACNGKGGSLALALTAPQLTDLNRALDAADGGTRTGGGPAFWIGAQAAYNYAYAPCGTNGGRFIDGGVGPGGTFSTPCRTASATSYEWLRGGSLAQQRGLDPAIVAGSNRNNAFPVVAFPASPVPDKAGVTYVRNGTLSHASVGTRLPFICSYDGASEVKASSSQATFNIEFSIGLNAAACIPSNRIGACISLDFQIFVASWMFGSIAKETNVFRGVGTARYQQSLFGETQNVGKWERKLLTGALNFELRAFFFTKSFKIKDFGAVEAWDGDIFTPAPARSYFRRFRE